jgi:hypothetical protein
MHKRYSYLFGCGHLKKVATPSISYIQSVLVVTDTKKAVLEQFKGSYLYMLYDIVHHPPSAGAVK